MRTRLTLDDEVASRLRALARRSGRTLRDVVNDVLRRGLATRRPPPSRPPYKVHVRDLGALRPGLTLDNIGDLLERVEGPLHR